MIEGKNVVVSGIVPGHSRGTAQAFVQDAGAYVQSSMSAETDILIVGAKPGPKKIVKAKELGIQVLTWEDMLAGFSGNGERADSAQALTEFRVVAPQLALAGDLPKGEDWLFEVKWDGYRCIATVKDGKVAMQSRSGRSEYVEQFPKVAAALAGLPDCVLDGELIVMGADGVTSFETAHQAASGMEAFIVFDAIEVEGEDVRKEPLWQRREGIKTLFEGDEGVLRISPAHDDGEWLYAWVAEQGLEGVVAKRKSSRYVEGSRTEAWIKAKVRLEQEFVVLGWKAGEGSKAGAAGSLLLGVRIGDPKLPPIWKSCGRVGTGRDYTYWKQFTELPPASPGIDYDFGNATDADLKGVNLVEPTTIVQVQFQRWTKDDRLWHPSLQRIRQDKDPLRVVRET